MSIQSNRSAKNNGNVNTSLTSGSNTSTSGNNGNNGNGNGNGSGQRRSVLKYSRPVTTAGSSNDLSITDALTDLLASSCGKSVVATVASGARYQGILVTADVSTSGSSSMSIVLANPTLASRSLISEKSNVDEKLPEKLVIQGKDLIDVEVSTSVADNKDSKESNEVKEPKEVKDSKEVKEPKDTKELKEAKDSKKSPETTSERNDSKPADVIKPISYSDLVKKAAQPSVQSTERKLSSIRLDDKPTKSKSPTASNTSTSSSTPAPTQTKAPAPAPAPASSKFKTDRDISAGFKFKEREFQMWQPDEGTEELTLEDNSTGSGQWDQFKVNEEKFGVESTYDEHLYTTRVNTSAKDYNERLQRAQRIAREIEGLSTSDLHVMEERGATVDDSGMDEEDKYSGVLAEPKSVPVPAETKLDTRGIELMAALGKGSISSETRSGPYISEQKPLISETGKYTTPGQRAAHYHNDPAIVSSSALKKPPTSAQTEKPSGVSITATAATTDKSLGTAVEGPESAASLKGSAGSSAGSKKPSKESFRLNAQSEINSLKEFSASFKVPHKLPNDLIPILAKDKSKQDEIMKKQDLVLALAANPEKGKEPKGLGTESREKITDSRKLSTSTVGTVDSGKEVKLFKLNPKAAAFTPSRPVQASPLLSNKTTVTSPRMQTTKLPGSYNTRDRKHHALSAAEIFGSAENIPTAEGKKKKLQRFRQSFNILATTVKEYEAKADKTASFIFPRLFVTPPTWDSTVDESYEKIITEQYQSQSHPGAGGHPGMTFMGSQMMVGGGVPGGVPGVPGGYGVGTGGKFPLSQSMQNSMAAAQFQQQQMQAAMFYQQFQGAGGRPSPQMMYMAAPGNDPQYMAPGFMVPGMMTAVHGHMSPTYTGGDMGYGGAGGGPGGPGVLGGPGGSGAMGGIQPLQETPSNGYSNDSRGHGHGHNHTHSHSGNHGSQNHGQSHGQNHTHNQNHNNHNNQGQHGNHNNHGNHNTHGNQSGSNGHNGREYSGNGYNGHGQGQGQGQGNRRYNNQKRTYNT